MTSSTRPKSRAVTIILVTALLAGALPTALTWLRAPTRLSESVFWAGLGGLALLCLTLLRQIALRFSKPVVVLIVSASVALVYLFPELFGPACDGTPRVLALGRNLQCAPECRIRECTRWVPEGHPRCSRGGSGGGCCLSYTTQCDSGCSGDPGGGSDQPPTISSALNCSQAGNNGWCIGSETLDLTASDPQGQAVMISGDVNGTPFACPNGDTFCSVPLPEGGGTVTYLVTSTTTLTANGTANWILDATTPQIDGVFSGSGGTNGWYRSDVTVSASAADSTSGLAAFDYSLDNGSWAPYTSPFTISNGSHTLTLRALDAAGNLAEAAQSINIDTITPILNLSLNGTSGANGWYASNVQITAAATDTVSGLASFEYSLDSTTWAAFPGTLNLSDGSYTITLRATDSAGNITETVQNIKVDTTTPTLDLSTKGTNGANGWHASSVEVSAAANDPSSGLAALEVSVDGAAYATYTNPIAFTEGRHTYRFRSTDQAGNITETPVQNVSVDTLPPVIDLPESWQLGQTMTYKVQDEGSGLAVLRVVVEDDNERWPKVTWDEVPAGNKHKGEIAWDGKFKDGTQAPVGTYYVTVKASDVAGNESTRMGNITIEDNLLKILPPFIAPLFAPSTPSVPPVPLPSSFGGQSKNQPGVASALDLALGGENSKSNGLLSQQGFGIKSASKSPVANPGSTILWGATAAAAIGAFAAETQRRKKNMPSAEEKEANGYRAKIRAAKMRKVDLKGELDAATAKAIQEAEADLASERVERKLAEVDVSILHAQAAREWARQVHRAGERQPEKFLSEMACVPKPVIEPKTPWEKELRWIDNHQAGVSIGVGVAIGLGVLAILVTGGMATPLVAAGWAALAAGGTVALGTVGLNSYYDRPLGTNVVKNVTFGAGAAAITAFGGALIVNGALQQAIFGVGNSVAALCGTNPAICSRMDTVMNAMDMAEQGGLLIKLGVQTALGDQAGAGETAIELQLEHMDGGVPGNTIAKEMGEKLAELGDDAVQLIGTHGDDIVPYLVRYGDNAVDIIGAYGDNGVKLIAQYQDDAVYLIKNYGTPAVNLLNEHGNDAIKVIGRLEPLLDRDVLEFTMKQGPDAVMALNHWEYDDFLRYGDELALRAAQDAIAIDAARKLAKLDNIDTPEARELIRIIAENSIHVNGDRLVLGRWVEGTFDDGFIGIARKEGGMFYSTNPGVAEAFGEAEKLDPSDLYWAVNEEVLQIAVDSKWKIDYSYKGLESDSIRKEFAAIAAILEGKSRDEIAEIFKGRFPFRMREVQFLVEHGYKYVVDEAVETIHWVIP